MDLPVDLENKNDALDLSCFPKKINIWQGCERVIELDKQAYNHINNTTHQTTDAAHSEQ